MSSSASNSYLKSRPICIGSSLFHLVCRKWAISGCASGGRHTVGSAPDDKSFHSVANRPDGCTMVPFSRSKRKFRINDRGSRSKERRPAGPQVGIHRSEEHTSELQSLRH